MMQQSIGSSSSSSSSLIFSLTTTSSLRSSPPPPPSPCRVSTKVRRNVLSMVSSFESSSTPPPPPPWRRKPHLKRTVDNQNLIPPSQKQFIKHNGGDVVAEKIDYDPLKSFNKRIGIRAKFGDPMPPGMATEFLNEVKRSGLLPDVITYTTLISSCSRWSNFEEGLEIYNHMLASNCRPSIYTYSALISLYGRCGMTKESEKIFKELKSKGCLANVVMYNSLINAFAKEGNVEKAREICEEMTQVGIAKNKITYGTIIQMYSNCGHHDLALQTYYDMVASDCEPDLQIYLNIIISAYSLYGMATKAETIFKEMRSKRFIPDVITYASLMDVFSKEPNNDKVREICEEMTQVRIAKD